MKTDENATNTANSALSKHYSRFILIIKLPMPTCAVQPHGYNYRSFDSINLDDFYSGA
jgi:hypothetical protein